MKTDQIDYQLTKQHFNVKIYRSYLQYVAKKYPAINLSQVCSKAGLPFEYLSKSDGWVSVEFNSRFMRELKKNITDQEFEFKVGEASFSKEIMGPVYFLMKNILSLEEIYNNIWKFPKHFNKVTSFHAVKRKKGRIVIAVKIVADDLSQTEIEILKESLTDIVNNSLGFYSGFSKSKNLNSTVVTSIRVSDLEYHIDVKYPQEKSKLAIDIFASTAVGTISSFLTSLAVEDHFGIYGLGAIAGLIFYGLKLKKQNTVLAEAANQAEETLNKLDSQYKNLIDTKLFLQRKLREAEAINELTNALIQTSSEDEILQNATDLLTHILDFDRALIMLQDSEKKFLEVRAHSISDKSLLGVVTSFKLPIEIESTDMTKVSNIYRFGKPILVADVNKHILTLSQESQDLLRNSKSKSFIGVPINSGSSSSGVLLVDTFYTERELTIEDMNILSLAGRQIAIALEKQKAQAAAVEAYVELGMLAKSYSRFVPFETIDLLGFKSVMDVRLEAGKEFNMAIVFCDIRGFTTLSEVMQPSEAMSFLNSYFSSLAPVFQRNKGIIDKFMGDGIMALFMDANNAFKASSEFQKALEEYNKVHRSGGKREIIRTGMGIHYGKVLLGAVGYEDRLSISVVSDAVNLTSRLDGLTKKFGVDILCSHEAFEQSHDKENFRLIAELNVEGRKGLTKIYEYFGHQTEMVKIQKTKNKELLLNLIHGTGEIPDLKIEELEDTVLKVYYEQHSQIRRIAS